LRCCRHNLALYPFIDAQFIRMPSVDNANSSFGSLLHSFLSSLDIHGSNPFFWFPKSALLSGQVVCMQRGVVLPYVSIHSRSEAGGQRLKMCLCTAFSNTKIESGHVPTALYIFGQDLLPEHSLFSLNQPC